MRQIQDQGIAELLLQLRFTPEKKRREQLEAAERLYEVVKDDKEYPFEFVYFRVTGFLPKTARQQHVIQGGQLREDLRIFIARLSSQLAEPVDRQREQVYTIQELAAELGVSVKTLHRWRKRGLLARKYIFEDGVKRFGFVRSAVEKFVEGNPELAARAKRFCRLSAAERRRIVRRAAALAAKPHASRRQIISKIAAELGRSHETVRKTLVNYEKAHPARRIFSRPAGVTEPAEAAEIYRLYKQGTTVKELMARFGRSKSSIYRFINIRRTRALLLRKIEFVASEEFLRPDAEESILKKKLAETKTGDEGLLEPLGPAGRSLPDYLRIIKEAPVLNRERERELFRRYNYLKYRASVIRAGIKGICAASSVLGQIEGYLSEAEEIKRVLIEANLRLVVSIARRHAVSGVSLPDLISEGNIALMRAVEKFDYSRGFRFATFASWTIAKEFARKLPAEAARRDWEAAASLARLQQDLKEEDVADLAAIERAHQSLAQVISDELEPREQYIILNRFGPIGQPVKKKTKTLKEIGDELGLSKERVRQLELVALQKLRQSLSPKEFEMLTG